MLGISNQASDGEEAVGNSSVSLFGGSSSHDDGEYTEDSLDSFVVDIVEGGVDPNTEIEISSPMRSLPGLPDGQHSKEDSVMKRYFRTIILVLVGVLLLAACGAVPASTGEAPAEKAEERAPRSEAMMEQAPKAEAKMAEPARSRPTRVPAPAAEAKAEAPASRTQSSQATTRQPAVRPPQQTAGATTFKDYPRATFVTTARDAGRDL